MRRLSRVAPRAVLKWAFVALLTATSAWHAVRQVPASVGVDLWHPWGIHVVRQDLRLIGDPYTNAAAYARHLERLASRPGASAREVNAALFWASRGANGFEPTGTPALYALMGFLPRDFDRAHALWAFLSYLAAAWSGWALVRLRGGSVALAMGGAALAVLFNPVLFDVRTSNVACVQLAAIVAVLRLAACGGADERARRLLPAVLAALVVFKPNVLPVAVALMAHYGVVRARREWLRDLGLAVLVLVVLVAAGEVAVGPGAWAGWWRYIRGMSGGTLLYTASGGNLAPAAGLAGLVPALGIAGWSAALAGFTTGAILVAAALAARPGRARVAVERSLADPWFAASVGCILMVAAPLYWYNYNAFLLVPLAWLLVPARAERTSAFLAALALLLLSVPWIEAIAAAEWMNALSFSWRYAWSALVAALLVRVVRASPPRHGPPAHGIATHGDVAYNVRHLS